MKFVYCCNEKDLKVYDEVKFGDTLLDQNFFPKIIDDFLGKQEHLVLDYGEVAGYLNNFITETEIKKTDISGLIIPVQHGDVNEILNIRGGLEKRYKKLEENFPELRENWDMVDFYRRGNGAYWNNPNYKRILEKAVKDSHMVFRNAFNFPIFEAYKHLPGHRNTPVPTDLIGRPVPEALDYVEGAFKVWLNRNFNKK